MNEIRWDTTQQAIVVSLTFDTGKLAVEASIKPNVRKGQLEVVDTRVLKGKDLDFETKFQIHFAALKELMAWMKQRLQKPNEWVRVSSLEERIEIAFIYTLTEYDDGMLERIAPLGKGDLMVLYQLAADIRQAYAEEKTKRGKPDWQEVKRYVLRDWHKQTPVSEDLRDFYSKVLARANAWKWDRVPRPIFERVGELRPGFMLLFRLQ